MRNLLITMYALGVILLLSLVAISANAQESIDGTLTYTAPTTRLPDKNGVSAPLSESEIAGYRISYRYLCEGCVWLEIDELVLGTSYDIDGYILPTDATGVEFKALTVDTEGRFNGWSESVEYLYVYPPAKMDKPTFTERKSGNSVVNRHRGRRGRRT